MFDQLFLDAEKIQLPNFFSITKHGLYYADEKSDPKWICSPIYVVAYTNDEQDNNHGRLLAWKSAINNKPHLWALPMQFLASDGKEAIERLLNEGVLIAVGRTERKLLLTYIQTARPTRNAINLSRIGWKGDAFALPDTIYPSDGTYVLQSENPHYDSFKVNGTTEEWKKNVAVYAQGNSRLVFALSIAFAPPLLKISGEESGIIHFVGGSSIGKTSALRVAASVWGSGGENGFIKQWRTTGNALEAVAEGHNDCLLPLDEMGQADSKSVGDTVYMVGNNQGKSRMQSSLMLKKNYQWRTLVISTGEITLENKLAEIGKRAKAGMHVRCVNIPAEADGGYGIFENIHGFANGDEFSRHLKDACSQYYGAAIHTYIQYLIESKAELEDLLRSTKDMFFERFVQDNADGQVKRIAGRFALIAAAGEFAIQNQILPLTAGTAIAAAGQCFADAMNERGSLNNSEIGDGIKQIKALFERFGNSKFILLNSHGKIDDKSINPIDRYGYKQIINDSTHYYVMPEVYNNELCKGFNPRLLTKALVENGYIKKDHEGKNRERSPNCVRV